MMTSPSVLPWGNHQGLQMQCTNYSCGANYRKCTGLQQYKLSSEKFLWVGSLGPV